MKQTTLTWHSVDNMPTDTSKEYLVKTNCGFMVCSYCDSLFSSIHDFFDELDVIEWAELPECKYD